MTERKENVEIAPLWSSSRSSASSYGVGKPLRFDYVSGEKAQIQFLKGTSTRNDARSEGYARERHGGKL